MLSGDILSQGGVGELLAQLTRYELNALDYSILAGLDVVRIHWPSILVALGAVQAEADSVVAEAEAVTLEIQS